MTKIKRMKNQNKRMKFLALFLFYLAVFFFSIPFLKQLAYITTVSTVHYDEVNTLVGIDSIPFEAVQPLDTQEVFQLSNPDMPAIGFLAIEDIELSLPIFPGLSDTNMSIGAAAAYPDRNPKTTNTVLLGHHLGYNQLLFGKLLKAKPGNKIELIYLGTLYKYTVTDKKVVDESEVQYMEDKPQATITLITCDSSTASTDKRVVVIGKLDQQTKEKEEIKKVKTKQQVLIKENKQVYKMRFILIVSVILLLLFVGTMIIVKIKF